MKKYLFKIVALGSMLSYGMAYTQVTHLPNDKDTNSMVYLEGSGFPGTPRETLDADGKVLLKTPGEPVSGAIPLAIDSDRKVILNNKEADFSFKIKTYIIPVTDKTRGEEVRNYALPDIEYDKYYPSLVNYKVMRLKNGKTSASSIDDLEISTISTLSVTKNTGGTYRHAILYIALEDGRAVHPTYNQLYDFVDLNYVTYTGSDREAIFQSIPKVFITTDDSNKRYLFTGDLGDSQDSFLGAKNYWVIEVLLTSKSILNSSGSTTIKKRVISTSGTPELTDPLN